MGTNTRVAMHSIAYKEAINNGPRLVMVNGQGVAAYALSKRDLAKLFELNGWSSDRIAWLKAIRAWRDLFDDFAPRDLVLFNKDAEWTLLFKTMSASDFKELTRFATANKVGYYNQQIEETSMILNQTEIGADAACP